MGPHVVVVAPPILQRQAGLHERGEQSLVRKLVAQATVETFDEGVLHRLARRNVVPVDLGNRPSPGWRCRSVRYRCRRRLSWTCRASRSEDRAHAQPAGRKARYRRQLPGIPELALPVVEGRLADPVLGAQIGRPRTSSCSLKTSMICSSVNRFRFVVRSSFNGQIQFNPDKFAGATSPAPWPVASTAQMPTTRLSARLDKSRGQRHSLLRRIRRAWRQWIFEAP
jgi:hypothetical protein